MIVESRDNNFLFFFFLCEGSQGQLYELFTFVMGARGKLLSLLALPCRVATVGRK